MRAIIATTNSSKFIRIKSLLSRVDSEIKVYSSSEKIPAPAELEDSPKSNSELKLKYYEKFYPNDLLIVCDDSIEIREGSKVFSFGSRFKTLGDSEEKSKLQIFTFLQDFLNLHKNSVLIRKRLL